MNRSIAASQAQHSANKGKKNYCIYRISNGQYLFGSEEFCLHDERYIASSDKQTFTPAEDHEDPLYAGLRIHTAESLDQVDASVFNGDQFLNKKARDALRRVMERWERHLKEIEEHN